MANGLFGGGDGASATPFLVEDAADLNAVRNQLGKAYKQVADIDLSAYENWVPIGSNSVRFTGFYDGGDFGVSNLKINGGSYLGLFGASNGTLHGINILSGQITTSNQYVGAVAGLGDVEYCSNQGCSIISTGFASGSDRKGGVTGSGKARNCFNHANLSGNGGFGGITGAGESFDCYNTGNISSIFDSYNNQYSMGIANGSSNAYRCYNTGNISTVNSSGTTYGKAVGISIRECYDCYNTGTITGDEACGITTFSAERCYNVGKLRAKNIASGITFGIAKNCYSLAESIYRLPGATATTFFKVTSSTSTDNVGNYALDTMNVVYE